MGWTLVEVPALPCGDRGTSLKWSNWETPWGKDRWSYWPNVRTQWDIHSLNHATEAWRGPLEDCHKRWARNVTLELVKVRAKKWWTHYGSSTDTMTTRGHPCRRMSPWCVHDLADPDSQRTDLFKRSSQEDPGHQNVAHRVSYVAYTNGVAVDGWGWGWSVGTLAEWKGWRDVRAWSPFFGSRKTVLGPGKRVRGWGWPELA